MVPRQEIDFVTRCLQAIPMTLILYDWCLMLGDEIELIWKRPTRTIVIFYVGVRYFPLALVFVRVPSFVFQLSPLQSSMYIMAMLAMMAWVQVLLQMRLYAMYLKSKVVLWTNAGLFVVEFTVVLCLVLRLPFNLTRSASFAEAYAAPLCYELYLVVLAVGKCWIHRDLSRQLGASSTLDMLARGSALYFILCVQMSGRALIISLPSACSVAGGIALSMIFLLFVSDYIGWLDILSNATSSIGGARLILSVQRSFVDSGDECTQNTTTVTAPMDIQLGSVPSRDLQVEA